MLTGTPIPEGTSTLQGLTCLVRQASLAPALHSDAGKRSESLKDTVKRCFCAAEPAISLTTLPPTRQ